MVNRRWLLPLLLPTCADALLPAARSTLLRRRGPALHSRSTAPLRCAAEEGTPQPKAAWRLGDELDQRIASLALPAVVSFMILPVAQATDLFWVGRMGEALAVAGQAATNQVYSSMSMVTSTIPTILTPRVAAAHANGDKEAVQQAIGESIVMSAVIGSVLTAALWFLQLPALLALGNRNALRFSVPYLRSRLPGIVLEGTSVVGFASFRGVMDTVTPLQAPGWSNAVKWPTLEAASSSPRGGGWAPSGWVSLSEYRAAQSRQARPEEAQGASWALPRRAL